MTMRNVAVVAFGALVFTAFSSYSYAASDAETSGGPLSAGELGAFRAAVPPEFIGTPSQPHAMHEDFFGVSAWQCDASPAAGFGTPTYWISANLAYSRYQALAYCTAYNGVACYYECGLVP